MAEPTPRFITLPRFADTAPVDVFHRQLQPKEIPAVLPKDLHILSRAHFRADAGAKTVIRVTADDCYKL